MSKYKRIEPIVEAVQWFDGDTHPMVSFHNNCNYRMCPVCGGDAGSKGMYYIANQQGRFLYIKDSNWIVIYENGNCEIYTDSYFKKIFTLIQE